MLDLKPKPRTHTPPASRWRNHYRIYRVMNLGRIGTVFPGVHAGPDAFPSKEIAEQHALTMVAAVNPPGRFLMEFAGAYPEGGSAN